MQLLQILGTLVMLVMTCMALPTHEDANSHHIRRGPNWPMDGKSIKEQARIIREFPSYRSKEEDVQLLELYENFFRTYEYQFFGPGAARTNLGLPFWKEFKEFDKAYRKLLSQKGGTTRFKDLLSTVRTYINRSRAHRAVLLVDQSSAFKPTLRRDKLRRLGLCDLWEIIKNYLPEPEDPQELQALKTYLTDNAPSGFNRDTDCDDSILRERLQRAQIFDINPDDEWLQRAQIFDLDSDDDTSFGDSFLSELFPEKQEEPAPPVETRPSLWDRFNPTRLWKWWG